MLKVSDQHNLSDQKIWQVITKPIIKAENVAENKGLSKTEVSTWLESIRKYWESKNIPKLVALGIIDSSNASKLREVMAEYGSFQVKFNNIDIKINSNQATVSFDRADKIDGNILKHPDRTVINIEKEPDGRLIIKN